MINMGHKKSLSAIAYTRVSSEKQVDNYSLDFQEDFCSSYAKANNMELKKIFREEGHTGTNTNRPAYQEMRQYLKESHVDVVLVHHLDRLHRDETNTFNDLRYFRQNHIRLLAIADGIDSDDEMASLVIAVKAALAADFSRNLAKETRKGLIEGAKEGRHMGGKPPYGFKVNHDTGFLEIDETTAPAVRQMFQLYAESFTTGQICDWLKQHHYKTRSGNDFTASALNSIFHNEKYKGCYTWDKAVPKDSEGHRNSHKQKEEYIRIEGGCPAVVPPELFEKVQEKLKENSLKASRNKAKRYYPLNGRIFCGECRQRMTGNVQYSGKSKYYQYRCSSGCGNKPVRAEYLENYVLNVVKECLFSETNANHILESLNQLSIDHKHETDAQYQQLMTKKAGLETAQNNLLNALESGKGTSAIQKRLERLCTESEQIEIKLTNINRTHHQFTEEDLNRLKQKFETYLMTHDTVNTKRLLDCTIQKIDIGANEIQLDFADSISISSETKKKLKGDSIMNTKTIKNEKNVTLNAFLLGLRDGESKNELILHLAIRPYHECNYSSTCDLALSMESVSQLLMKKEIELWELIGCKMDLTVKWNGEQITQVLDLNVA